MIKDLTIVFNAYYSEKSLSKVLKNLNKFKIIIIENSQQISIKNKLEKKFKNVKVLIPKKNLGLAGGYNMGIKNSKTKYIFLNNPDIKIKSSSIIKLLEIAKKSRDFGIIAPVYDDEKIFKNYNKIISKNNKYGLISVDWIDNNFLINKLNIKNNLFSENFFLYFETIDFCLNLKRKGKKLFIAKKIKFTHFGSKSIDSKLDYVVKLTRSWHYNWSKFYYFRKNFNYIYAFTKIMPNFYQSLKNSLMNLILFNFKALKLNLTEIYGICSAIFCFSSFYRAKK